MTFLLSVEMRDHRENKMMPPEQRKRIADILEGFIKKASRAMGQQEAA